MKRALLFLLCAVMSVQIFSTVDISAELSQWCDTWNVFVENGSVYPPHEETYRYQLAKDTVIGDYTYTAVVSKAINDALDAPRYVAAVRFTDDRKVYIYYDNAEYLLYDFNVQEGDDLEVFAGINNYTSDIKTYKCTVTSIEQYACVGCPATITLEVHNHPNDFREFYRQTQWIEGVGDINGFLNGINHYVEMDGGGSEYLLCAYKGDELKYTGPLYEKYGCGDDAEQSPEDLFPTLWGLQRTGCTKTIGEDEYGTVWGSRSYLMQEIETATIDGKQYLLFGINDIYSYDEYCSLWLREENNKILVYSTAQKKDLVLYDFTLNVGDSLPRLYVDYDLSSVVDYDNDKWGLSSLVVTEVSTITLLDGKEYKKWTFDNGIEYVEGIGSFGSNYGHNDFYQLIVNAPRLSDVYSQHLVCASKNGQLLYKMDESEMAQLETECLCEAENPEDLFPTLWGLQRTVCNEYCEETEDDNSANNTYQQTFERIFFENDKPYILCSGYLLREEDNMILIYSQTLNKDLVLYDFTLEVGDSLLALYINAPQWDPPQSEDIIIVTPPYNGYVVDHDYNGKPDPVVVTDISTVTLLDGKEHKKWTFNNGMEYVEGIGSFGNDQWSGDFFQLIANKGVPTSLLGEHLVCVSKNNKLLYMMDDAEMERLGAECLCDYDRGPLKDNAKNGKIGGRPTPTQWNMLEVDLREMENGNTILRAETFSYTLENDSIVTNGKTFYQLARQSTKDTAITKSFVGALHFGEDEDNRVYFFRDGHEYVLYDFTAEPGDTLEIFAGINNYPQDSTYTHVVIGKDTIENGACRMTLEVVFPNQTSGHDLQKVWLAGLGSIDGIVHNAAKRTSDTHAAPSRSAHNSDTQTSIMLCAWRDDNCLYTTDHPDYGTYGCVYNQESTSIEDIHTSPSYQKFIRDGQLFILYNGNIYNVMGVELK